MNSSKKEIVLSYDTKELFVQLLVQFFDQNRKHVEARNQSNNTPGDFAVLW